MSPNLHSFFVHFPVAISFILPLMIAWALFHFKKNEASANKLWFMVAFPMVILALSTIMAVITGNTAHDLLEKFMDDKPIQKHAEIAEVFAMLVYMAAGLSLFIFIFREKRRFTFMLVMFGLSLVMMVLALISGKTGGEVVHKYESPAYLNKAVAEERKGQK